MKRRSHVTSTAKAHLFDAALSFIQKGLKLKMTQSEAKEGVIR